MDESDVARATLNEGADGGSAVAAGDEVPLPVAEAGPGLHLGRAVIDQLPGRNEPRRAGMRPPATLSQRPTGAEPLGERPAQTTFGAVVEGLVDRFVADVPGTSFGIGDPQPGADLLGAPVEFELAVDDRPELCVAGQPPGPATLGPLTGAGVGEVAVVDAVVVRSNAAPKLTADRRGRPLEAACDLPDPQALGAERGDPLPLEPRQVALTTDGLGDAQWRQPSAFDPPPVSRLAADAKEPTRLDGSDSASRQPPILVLDPMRMPLRIAGVLPRVVEPARW